MATKKPKSTKKPKGALIPPDYPVNYALLNSYAQQLSNSMQAAKSSQKMSSSPSASTRSRSAEKKFLDVVPLGASTYTLGFYEDIKARDKQAGKALGKKTSAVAAKKRSTKKAK